MNTERNLKEQLRGIFIIFIVYIICAGCSADRPQFPETAIVPVTNTYHGVEVIDNYQWLENGEDNFRRSGRFAGNAGHCSRRYYDSFILSGACAENSL